MNKYLENVLKELDKEFNNFENKSYNISFFQDLINKVKDDKYSIKVKVYEDEISHINIFEISLFEYNKKIIDTTDCFYWEEDFDFLEEIINSIDFFKKKLRSK